MICVWLRTVETQRIVLEYCLRESGFYNCNGDRSLAIHHMTVVQNLNEACPTTNQSKNTWLKIISSSLHPYSITSNYQQISERAIITSNGDTQFNMKSITSRSDKFVDNLCSDPLKIVFKY